MFAPNADSSSLLDALAAYRLQWTPEDHSHQARSGSRSNIPAGSEVLVLESYY